MSRPFLASVAPIIHRPGERRRERRRGVVPDLAVSGSAVPEGAEVEVDVVLEWVSGGILATGTVATRWEGSCRRCLSPTGGELRVEVKELYSPDAGPEDEERYPLTGDVVDLEVLAHDAVILELPLAPLCREDCRGLCPSCGADRNREPCGCSGHDPSGGLPDPTRRPQLGSITGGLLG
jgi:uncharacterized protein